ncbi:MAG: hypothetical protein GWN73_13100, partial [Actinobacteria bacterium]|nr:hypothetical protein [Actinomycetota bacterium]NIU66299.1 hypothetical protein [Actinomycetota bacterium]
MDVGVDGGDAATDATTDTRRRTAECWSEALERPCCFSRSNADRLDSPELLVVYLAPTEPAAFLGVGNVAPFVEMVQSRRLTWLLDLEVAADGATTLVTGSGRATEEDRNVYGFLDPTTNLVVDGTIVDETLNTEPSS